MEILTAVPAPSVGHGAGSIAWSMGCCDVNIMSDMYMCIRIWMYMEYHWICYIEIEIEM